MRTPNWRSPVPVLPEYVMLVTVELFASALVLMRRAWSLKYLRYCHPTICIERQERVLVLNDVVPDDDAGHGHVGGD